MADSFVGEIRIFGGPYAPPGWMLCDGSIQPIARFPALFAVIGNAFGGDGRTTFGLPKLQDNVPLGAGQGPGLGSYAVGQQVGTPAWVLSSSDTPPHSHPMECNFNKGDLKAPAAGASLAQSAPGSAYVPDTDSGLAPMDASSLSAFAGGGQPHNNLQPYLALTFIIATSGQDPRQYRALPGVRGNGITSRTFDSPVT